MSFLATSLTHIFNQSRSISQMVEQTEIDLKFSSHCQMGNKEKGGEKNSRTNRSRKNGGDLM